MSVLYVYMYIHTHTHTYIYSVYVNRKLIFNVMHVI